MSAQASFSLHVQARSHGAEGCPKQAMEEHQLDPFDALDLVKTEDGRFLGGGDVRIGDFILLVDSDTRIPVDCILPTVSELLQSPQVGFTQHLIAPMQVPPSFLLGYDDDFTSVAATVGWSELTEHPYGLCQ